MMKRKLLNVPLAVNAQTKARTGDDVSTPNAAAAKKTTRALLAVCPKETSVTPKSDSQYGNPGTLLVRATPTPTPAQGPAKRRKLLLLSKHAEPQPAASTTTSSKPAKQAAKSISASHRPSPSRLPESTQQSAVVQEIAQNESMNAPTADSQPTLAACSRTAVDASTASLLQAARPHAENAAQPSGGLRGKPGSSSPTAAAATGTPSGKFSGQPLQPSVSLTSTPKPKPSATPVIQADGASHAAEISLAAHNDSSASSTPVQLAKSRESSAGAHGNAALLPDTMSAQKLPHRQASKRSSDDATALLPVPMVRVPAVSQVNAEPVGKAAAAIPQVYPSMEGVIKDTAEAAAIPQGPQSKKEGVSKNADSLLMVRRLPVVLTGTLPTLASLGVQVNLPRGADMLKQLPRKPQGSCAKHAQQLCHPGMVKGLQSRLMPQAADNEMSVTGSCSQATEDTAAFVMQSMQDNRLQEMLCSFLKDSGLTLSMPAIVAGGNRFPAADVPSAEPAYSSGTASPHKEALKDSTISKATASVQNLILKQQIEFADIWSSPEKQAEECSKAYDAFPVVLSFLQAVLS